MTKVSSSLMKLIILLLLFVRSFTDWRAPFDLQLDSLLALLFVCHDAKEMLPFSGFPSRFEAGPFDKQI